MRGLGAVVLAAGASQRFGAENKLLADFEGAPLILRVVGEVAGSGVGETVVVTGCDEAKITQALERASVRFTHNARWQSGIGSSIAAGIGALRSAVDGAFIVPGDMPGLSSALLLQFAAAFEKSRRHAIVYPTAAGEQRNPVLWPRRFFSDLSRLSGPTGAKALLQAHADEGVAVPIEDDSMLDDVDTPDDLALARA
jgi:molybdenum cofactor cytidylyltransferase